MGSRFLGFAAAFAVVMLLPANVAGQAPGASKERRTSAAKASTAPRTAEGQPDLQGVWSYATLTPLERPRDLADKAFFADQAEAAEFERRSQRNQDVRDATPRGNINGAPTTADVERAYNDFWWDFGKSIVGTRRTSLVVDPPDGRIPPLSAEARQRQAARAAAGERPAQGPEDRSLGERCIHFVNRSGPPMTPSAYNNNFQLFQTRDYVAILNEQAHDVRIIPLDGRARLPQSVRQWKGDSRGRWQGDTLVVETTNFTGLTNFMGSGRNMHLVERFRRVGPETLLYEFTVTDPESFAKPWTAEIPLTPTGGHIYEYACHEGNYGMANLLSAARAIEKTTVEPDPLRR